MYSKDNSLDLNSYINCLWNYFQTYYKSIKKNLKNNENKWLEILKRSKLKLSKDRITHFISDPNNIFKVTNYKDIDINQIQILKLRYFICLFWLNYLVISENSNYEKIEIIDIFLLDNWVDSIETIISIFESRNEILILERDNIYNNLSELEKIRIRCPNLDPVHQNRLESQLKALRHILNLESTQDLRILADTLNRLKSNKYEKLNSLIDSNSTLKDQFKDFLEIFEHISSELLTNYVNNHVKIFNIKKLEFDIFVNTNLKYKDDLIKFKNIIYNTKSLTWSQLDKIKIIELKINLKNYNVTNMLIIKVDKVCNLIYKIVLENNSLLLTNGLITEYENLVEEKNNQINKLKILKNKNYDIVSNLEKTFNYSDLKDIDLEFYYQFLIHLTTILNGIKNKSEVNINTKKYISDEVFMDRKNLNNLIKTLNSQFVSKREFRNKIHEIETRITNVEENKPGYILGTMVISLISLFIWKKMLKFKSNYI